MSNERDIVAIVQKYGLPEIVARILASRKVQIEDVEKFLNPTIRDYLPDPFHLLDMEIAANRLCDAVINNEKIGILGDYDVDGATSTALLLRYFKLLAKDVIFHIPDRILEGYGPNIAAMQKFKDLGCKIVITVDCGTLSFEPIEYAKKIGLDVIVVDHHISEEKLPDAFAIINPNRLDEKSQHGYMAAVGVVFLLIVAINSILRKRDFFLDNKIPDLLQLLDIVALGTVCDVVPLKLANRAFVAQGLKILRKRQNLGLAGLSDIAQIDESPTTYHLGFVLGPRINAGGRVGKSDLGTKLMVSDDIVEIKDIASQLNNFNAERKSIEQMVLDEAIEQVEQNNLNQQPLIMVVGEGWHPGVIGIVAGRLKERYHKPTAVITLDHKNIGKASARSINGVDFGSAIVAANQCGILIAGGGHAMAAGFTVSKDKISDLRHFLNNKFAQAVEKFGQRKLYFEGFLTVSSINEKLIEQIAIVGPFGTSNYEPHFVVSNVIIVKSDVFADSHIRVFIKDANLGDNAPIIKAMAFRSNNTPMGDVLLNQRGCILNIAGKLKINKWQGLNRAELIIEDIIIWK